MSPEQFLRTTFRHKLESNKQLSKQTETFKRQAEAFTVMLWKQSVHRADEAIRQGISRAKQSMNKRRQ